MRKSFLAVVVGCAAAMFLVGGLALAQEALQATVAMDVNIPFSFTVHDRELPGGQYEIGPAGNHLVHVVVVGDWTAKAGGEWVSPVVERLADTGASSPYIVFDNVEGKHILSEVHLPGMDGFLLNVAGGRETHTVVHGTRRVPQ